MLNHSNDFEPVESQSIKSASLESGSSNQDTPLTAQVTPGRSHFSEMYSFVQWKSSIC